MEASVDPQPPGSRLDADHPENGVLIPCRFTHPGYAASQRVRKRIEEAFGWIKTVAGLRKTKLRGLPKVDWSFTFAAGAYNLVRAPKLIAAAT